MYNIFYLAYILSFIFYLNHKNLILLHYTNRFIVSISSFSIPLFILYDYFFVSQKLLTEKYYLLLTNQCLYYTVDLFPVYFNKQYSQVYHHLLGYVLNYLGYIYRFNPITLIATYNIYFFEQGLFIFHSLMKILDHIGYKHTNIRNICKKVHFNSIKISFFIKIILTILSFYGSKSKVVLFAFILQLIWNYYTLKKAKIL